MAKRGHHTVTVIRYSCINGKAVWVYRGPSRRAADVAYCRACKNEVEYMARWSNNAAVRRSNILQILNRLTASVPVTAAMSPEREAAARQLLALSKESTPFCRDFYDHVVEERRRRKEDSEIRKRMRQRDAARNEGETNPNHNYDK